MDKACTKCNEVKSLEFFSTRRASKDGLCYMCKACSNATNKVYREAHPEMVEAKNKAYYDADPEKCRAATDAWRAANPDRTAAMDGKANAIARGASVSDIYNVELCMPFYAEARRLTLETGILHHVDHIIPINKGGLHCQTNLQVLTAAENLKKGDKLNV